MNDVKNIQMALAGEGFPTPVLVYYMAMLMLRLLTKLSLPADSRCTVLRKQDSGDVPVSHLVTLNVVFWLVLAKGRGRPQAHGVPSWAALQNPICRTSGNMDYFIRQLIPICPSESEQGFH